LKDCMDFKGSPCQ